MQLKKLKIEVKTIPFQEIRKDNSDYFEAVLLTGDLSKLNLILEKVLGQAIWPSVNLLPSFIQKVVSEFGGIQRGQTLYFLKNKDLAIFAMIWPWQNGELVTLKIGQI